MWKFHQCILAIACAAILTGCNSYSEHAIDERPLVKIDSRLPGIWKAVEDTNRFDYIVIQTAEDRHQSLIRYLSTHNPETDTLISRSQAAEKLVASFKETRDRKEYYYYLTRMDHDGQNPHYQQLTSFPSRINGATFLNISYWNKTGGTGPGQSEKTEKGYFFVRILSINSSDDLLTIAVVKDPALRWLESANEVRKRITEKMNNPAYYSDTLHLYKVSDYHFSINDSRIIANPLRKPE